MRNFIESGGRFEVVLTADAAPGDIVVRGELVGVLVTGGVAGDVVAAKRTGAYWYTKVTGVMSQGDKLYLNSDNKLTKTDTDNPLVGYAFADAAAGDADVMFVLKS